jgi:FAD:protein FMN transferase
MQSRRTFAREAMAAVFQLTLVEPDPIYARQAADAALAELEQIENRLSRFVETGGLTRIARLGRGQTTTVEVDTFQCLRIALDVQAATDGAFDPAYASAESAVEGDSPIFAEAKIGTVPADAKIRTVPIELIEAGCKVRTLADGVRLDLGGIGKGFALDRMAALLAEWDIHAAMLCADASTVLGVGAPPGERGWRVSIEAERPPPIEWHAPKRSEGCDSAPCHALRSSGRATQPRQIDLMDQALSASGTAVRGAHILDPRTGRPATRKDRIWSLAPTAAEADALSTAFFVMTDDEVRDYCRRHSGISAFFLWTYGLP